MQNDRQLFGVIFHNSKLLEEALTHSSASQKKHGQPYHNERLEFLGDRVINLLMAEWLMAEFPTATEGDLAKRHAALISQPTMASIAAALGLGEMLILGKGEETTGGRQKPSMLADALEATLAALYLDQGPAITRTLVKRLWAPYVHTVEVKDPKSALQEWLQAQGLPLPTYTLLSSAGASHQKMFIIEADAGKQGKAIGEGSSKRQAELMAARKLLEMIHHD